MEKRGLQMAISTIILIVLGVLIMVGVTYMLMNQFGFFKGNVEGGQSSSNVDSIIEGCNLLVQSGQDYSYCCDVRDVKTSTEELELSCSESFGSAWTGGRILEVDCSSISC